MKQWYALYVILYFYCCYCWCYQNWFILWAEWYTYHEWDWIWREANGPLTRYVKLWVAQFPGMPGTFSPPPRVRDPDTHHGISGISCACATWQEAYGNYKNMCLKGKNIHIGKNEYLDSDWKSVGGIPDLVISVVSWKLHLLNGFRRGLKGYRGPLVFWKKLNERMMMSMPKCNRWANLHVFHTTWTSQWLSKSGSSWTLGLHRLPPFSKYFRP